MLSGSGSGRCIALAFVLAVCPAAFAQSPLPRAAPADRAAATQQILAGIAQDMVDIPAGKFRMGNLVDAAQPDEHPVHEVSVRPFRLGKHEVTFEQYDTYALATGRALPAAHPQDSPRPMRDPVVNISWQEAQEFIAWLNGQTGGRYRLPTEAEWEYAARSGSTSDYPWGALFDASRVNGLATGGVDQWANAAPVGSFAANAFGLHDMIGNVWEWTQDCWNGSYEGAPTDGSAWTAGNCDRRVVRGGSWNYGAAGLRVSNRHGGGAPPRPEQTGFRLAQDTL